MNVSRFGATIVQQWRRFLSIIFLCFPICLHASDGSETVKPLDIISKEGALNISDGSSIYIFNKDGSFLSVPVGMSGRKIEGSWTLEKGSDVVFAVEGRWGWANGFTPFNDFRIMRLIVYIYKRSSEAVIASYSRMPAVESSNSPTPSGSQPVTTVPPDVPTHKITIQNCYLVIDEIKKRAAPASAEPK